MTEEERRQLLAEKARIADEIRHYPMPIPRCDAQYNHLVERRAEIERALARKTDTQRSVTASRWTPEP